MLHQHNHQTSLPEEGRQDPEIIRDSLRMWRLASRSRAQQEIVLLISPEALLSEADLRACEAGPESCSQLSLAAPAVLAIVMKYKAMPLTLPSASITNLTSSEWLSATCLIKNCALHHHSCSGIATLQSADEGSPEISQISRRSKEIKLCLFFDIAGMRSNL